MNNKNIFQKLKAKFLQLVEDNNLLHEKVSISGKALTVEEAIGNPNRRDFPLVKGKEKLLQANFRGAIGQAFTDMPGNFEGTLEEIVNWPLKSHFDMAVFVSTLNAVLRYLKLIEGTIHCKDNEPEDCALKLCNYIKENYGNRKIALIGFQPSFLEQLVSEFQLRVLDLDEERIGTKKFGVVIEDGDKNLQEVLDWCEVLFATGSILANGTIENFINTEKPIFFYGTTIAGAAYILNLERYCKCGK